jgi:hypothetical protein
VVRPPGELEAQEAPPGQTLEERRVAQPAGRRGRRGRKALIAVLFLIFGVVELWSPIVHSGWYLPSDIGQLFSLTHIPGHPPTPKNTLTSDVYVMIAPFLHFDLQQVGAGHLPTWSDTQGNGLPLLANGQSVVFSPFTLFFYLLPFRLALIAAALARLWVLGFFTYLFLSRHRLHDLAAIVGGIVFAYAGYHLVWLDYQTIVSVSAWLPVSLWCAKVAIDADPDTGIRRKRAALLGLSGAVAAILVAGNPETGAFDLLVLAAYVVMALGMARGGFRRAGRQLIGFGVAAVLGVGLSAIQLLPFLQYASISTRTAGIRANPAVVIPGFTFNSTPLVAFPNLFGGPQYSYQDAAFYAWLHPPTNYAELNGNSVGLLTLCAVPLGLLALRRRRRQVLGWFGLGAAVVGTLLLYSHTAGHLWTHIPLLHSVVLNRSQDVELLGFAVLAALGVDWLIGSRPAAQAGVVRLLGRPVTAVAVFAVVGTGFTLGAIALRHHVNGIFGNPSAAGNALVNDQLAAEILLAAAFIAVLAAFCVLARHHRARIVVGGAVVVVVFASTGLMFRSYNPTVGSWAAYPVTPSIAKLTQVVGSGEVLFAGGSFPSPSTARWFAIREVGAYDAIGLESHDDLYRAVFHVPATGETMPDCVNGLRLFGVTTVVGGSGAFAGAAKAALPASGTINGVPYYRVANSSHFSVVGRSIAAPGDAAALRLVGSCAFDSRTTVVLDPTAYDPADRAALGPATGASAAGATVSHTTQDGATASAVVDTPHAAWLVVRESWVPGWRATVDGHPAAVQRADVAFQAVRVPAGRHVVRLFYDPGTLTFGGVVSSVALGCLLALALLTMFPSLALALRRRSDSSAKGTAA